ncbi:type II secretion system inner membrane protein GspF [uncultured Desulfuromonas sp.]|uniref:type II secretion system inner membrane protein GspF n=1 Tax=uncultured Desulfuromonas sp. TaxID=181013 RepID=UPI002AAACC2B|nr:type II secretion system inner membrane protein GspF [uncultured Desulfuromonas sp.]
MALFDYSGFNQQGKTAKGSLEAGSKRAALEQLRDQGIYVSTLEEQPKTAARRRWSLPRRSRLPINDLATTTRLLATLLQAGVPLDEALQSVVEQVENPVQARLYTQVREEVRQGSSLFQALAEQGRSFPDLYQRMVEVGENSGTLDQVLLRLADFLEEQARLRSRTVSALAYPVLMAIVGVGVLLFLLSFVVPKITRMLTDLGQALPLPTRLLITTSDLISAYGWLVALLIGGGIVALLRYRRTEAGRLKLDGWSLKLPLIGRIQREIATARFSRTLGTLLHSGVPLLKALEISCGLLSNKVLRTAVETTSLEVREGASLAEPLKRSGVFPPLLAQMTAVGERSGTLEEMLIKVADSQDRQVEITLAGLLSLLEPLMILAMGGIIGFIVLAVLLPIFQASQGLG